MRAQILDNFGPGAEIQVKIQLPYAAKISSIAKVELMKGDMPLGSDHANTVGEARFRGLKPGMYTVRVTMEGFKVEEQTVDLVTGTDTRQVFFHLSVDPSGASVDTGPSLEDPVVSVGVLRAPEKARKELNKARESRIDGDCKKAVEQAKKAAEIAPELVMAYQEMGMCQTSLGKIDDAQKSFETAIEKDPKFLYAYLNLARVLARKRKWQEATNTLAEASKQHPQRGEPYFEMAKLQLATNDPLRAEATAKMALARDCSRIPEIAFFMASLYMKNGDKAKAITTLQEFAQKNPDTPQAERAKLVVEQLKNPKEEKDSKKK